MKISAVAIAVAIAVSLAACTSVERPSKRPPEYAASAPPDQTGVRQAQATGLSVVVLLSERREGWRRVAMLNEPWFYCSEKTGNLYAVPAGFETDFASMPAFAKTFFPQFGDWAEAAVIHDWLYNIGVPGEREEADRIFDEAMKQQNVGSLRRSIMHAAVRLGGGSSYDKASKRDPEDWRENFTDREGKKPKEPPLKQPTQSAWQSGFDCRTLTETNVITRLRTDFEATLDHRIW